MAEQTMRLWYRGVVVSKKNSKVIRVNRRTGARYITSNNLAKQNEADMVAQFREQILKIKGYRAGDIAPCSIDFHIWEPDNKRRDLDNQITSILDALVRADVLDDDSIGNVRGFTVEYRGIDAKEPRVELVINKVEQEGEQ